MEVGGRNDARTARDRCLMAVAASGDLEEAQALWRAALRYNGRMKETAGRGLEIPTGRPRALSAGVGGGESVRELGME